jgi:hypothetical protein
MWKHIHIKVYPGLNILRVCIGDPISPKKAHVALSVLVKCESTAELKAEL